MNVTMKNIKDKASSRRALWLDEFESGDITQGKFAATKCVTGVRMGQILAKARTERDKIAKSKKEDLL